jgi:diguanylate cyclase (GGDEF)-like protein/PAS domain S-box-containing protein
MTDRTELLEAALDSWPDGIALVDAEGLVVFWNQAAEAITGYAGVELLARPAPEELEPLLRAVGWAAGTENGARAGGGALVALRHKLGHEARAMARTLLLRDGLGARIGTITVFHPTEALDALPHGEAGEDAAVQASQAELEERLLTEFEDLVRGGEPFGVLWVMVDQAHELRKTHGAQACTAMLEKVEHALAGGLRPGEQLGRWGEGEFLVLSHERTPEMLAAHAQKLAGLARTADFRWWGDRLSITVSVGAAQAERESSLAELLEGAGEAMLASFDAGGNKITSAPGRQTCSPL